MHHRQSVKDNAKTERHLTLFLEPRRYNTLSQEKPELVLKKEDLTHYLSHVVHPKFTW